MPDAIRCNRPIFRDGHWQHAGAPMDMITLLTIAAGKLLEAGGVLLILVGVVFATVCCLRNLVDETRRGAGWKQAPTEPPSRELP